MKSYLHLNKMNSSERIKELEEEVRSLKEQIRILESSSKSYMTSYCDCSRYYDCRNEPVHYDYNGNPIQNYVPYDA